MERFTSRGSRLIKLARRSSLARYLARRRRPSPRNYPPFSHRLSSLERAESRRVTCTKVDWEFIGADCRSREPLGFESGGLASVRVLRSYVTVNVICRSAALSHLGTRRSASVAHEAVRTTTLVDAMVVRGYLVMHDRGMSPFSCALLLTRAVAFPSLVGRLGEIAPNQQDFSASFSRTRSAEAISGYSVSIPLDVSVRERL